MNFLDTRFKKWYVTLNITLNIVCYLGFLACIMFGSVTDMLWLLLVYFIIGINEQAFYHRMYTHRSWNCPEWIKFVGLIISNLSLLGPVIFWVALHRSHHRYNDTEKDPHSPLYLSNFRIQFMSSSLRLDMMNAADLMKNKKCLFTTVYYFEIVLSIWIIMCYLMGPVAFFMIFLGGTGLSLLTANSINTWHHGPKYYFGQYQNGKIGPDTSKNDIITGYLTFDGWHNNHHTDPRSYYYGKKWWEVDLCGIYIWLISTVTGYRSSLK